MAQNAHAVLGHPHMRLGPQIGIDIRSLGRDRLPFLVEHADRHRQPVVKVPFFSVNVKSLPSVSIRTSMSVVLPTPFFAMADTRSCRPAFGSGEAIGLTSSAVSPLLGSSGLPAAVFRGAVPRGAA